MKIATYNVRNLYDSGTVIDPSSEACPVTEELFNKRVAHFTKLFKERDADIVCLQEVGGEKAVSMIGNELGYQYFFAKPNKRGIRMAVLYKPTIADTITCQSLSFGDLFIPAIISRGDMDSFSPITQRRDVLVIDLDSYKGKPVRIVTFHSKSMLPTYFDDDDMEHDEQAYTDARFRSILFKMMELRSLRSYVTTSMEEGREVILLGDLNEDRSASIVSLLRDSILEEHRLQDVLTGYQGDQTTHLYRGNKLTFDTIFVSNGLQEHIKEVAVFNQDLQDYSQLPPGGIEEVVEADHAMVMAEFGE